MDPAQARVETAMWRLRGVDEATARGDSAVQGLFRGAVVLVTGGSGFLGKQLVEKLFRSCDIKRLYLLLRQKKGKTSEERVAAIFQDPVYETLRKRKPGFEQRVAAIDGDIAQLRLGISHQDWCTLTNEVNFIFHVAATVAFDEPIQTAVRTNVRGTMQALLLARGCKHLKSFMHVSTAYSHTTRARAGAGAAIRDDFYASPAPPAVVVDLVERLSDDTLAAIKHKLIEGWPNTYTYTKALAEEAVRSMSGELPVCIVRPSVVIVSNLEPSPGWVDISSVYGPSGLILGIGLGVLHTFMADEDLNVDLIPVDHVNNATIAAAWATAQRHENGQTDIKIYPVTSARNPIKWRELLKILYSTAANCGTPKAMWYIFVFHTRRWWVFVLLTWLLHYGPGLLVDGLLLLLGKNPKAMKLYRTSYNLSSVLAYFTCNQFHFRDDNLVELQNSLSETDKQIFNFDVKKIDWSEQLVLWAIGVRKYIVKDELQGTCYARNKQQVLRVLNYVVGALYAFVLYKLFSYICWCLFVLFR